MREVSIVSTYGLSGEIGLFTVVKNFQEEFVIIFPRDNVSL